MCSLAEAVDSAKEHSNREKGLEAAHYYLTPVHTEAPFLLSDAGLQAADGTAMAIGVVALGVNPMDNTVNLTASDGPTSTLVVCCLLHLTTDLILVPPQLAHPMWTGMRRVKIRYESFIHFPDLYVPPNMSGPECNSQQLTLMEGLYIPEPGVLLDLTEQLDNLRTAPPHPRLVIPSQGTNMVLRMRLPKRSDQETPGRL